MLNEDSKGFTVRPTSMKIRWLGACTGLAMAPACLGITTFYLALPAVLIVGAVITGKWPIMGKWLMWVGAALLSILVLPWCIAILRHPGGPVDLMISACAASSILTPILDVALLLEGFGGRQAGWFSRSVPR